LRPGTFRVKADGCPFFLARRFPTFLITISGASGIIFLLLEVLPGDPALALMGLLPDGARVGLDGVDLLRLDETGRCRIRGNRIAMIFQEPMTSLNPVHRIDRQIAEPLRCTEACAAPMLGTRCCGC
jgi:ABC-type microcin C transport system duplicated ATPase subunit YejF